MSGLLWSELRKLRRSVVLWVILAVTVVPCALGLIGAARRGLDDLDWERGLSLAAESWALSAFVTLVVGSSYVFAREHENSTHHVLHSTPHPTRLFLLAKLAALLLLFALATLLALACRFTTALVLAHGPLAPETAAAFFRRAALVSLQYLMLLPWISLIAILSRRMYLATVLSLAVVIVLFPFHRAATYYWLPPVVPVAHFAATLGFGGPPYVFTPEGWVSLAIFLGVTLPLCFVAYRRE